VNILDKILNHKKTEIEKERQKNSVKWQLQIIWTEWRPPAQVQ